MANLKTTTDILQDALFHAGEPQGTNSEYYNQALTYLNRIYQEICSGGSMLDPNIDEKWWWLRKSTPGVLTLLPGIVLPTATVNRGNTLLTYSSPPLDPMTGTTISVEGFVFTIDGSNGDVYRIATHNAGQSVATLDLPYTGASVINSPQHTLKYQYTLAPDMKSIVGRMRAFQTGRYNIDYADIDPMRTRFPLSILPNGVPTLFAMVAERVAEFSHYVGDDVILACRVEYDYLLIPSDLVDDSGLTAPLLPFQYNSILSDEVTSMVLADKDDDKAPAFENAAKARLVAMSKEHRRRQTQSSNLTGKILPRQGDVGRDDSPLRTSSGFILG